MNTITITLRGDDAEPILRHAAERAARYGAYCDHITRKCYRLPSGDGSSKPLAERRKGWQEKFVQAKRMVEAFGVEYEQTTEPETMTVDYPWIGGTTKIVDVGPLGKVGVRSGSHADFKHPMPTWRGSVHDEACRQAADRVVRHWLASIA